MTKPAKVKINLDSILSALTILEATRAEKAVSYFELATHLQVKPLDSEGVANIKKHCKQARDTGKVAYIQSPVQKNTSLLYLRT